MKPKNENNELESRSIDQLEEKIKNRDRKKKKRMTVSGKSVFKVQELKKKRDEELSPDEE